MSTSQSYSSKIVSYNKVTHVDDFSLQQFMKTPFVGSTERWERPKMGCRRVIDSGCSDTMISRATVENYDCDTDTAKINVEFANGASATSIGTAETTVAGDIKLEAMVFENGVLSADLISVSQIVNEQNCDVLFTPMKVTAYNRSTKEKTVIGKKKRKDKLWLSVENTLEEGITTSKDFHSEPKDIATFNATAQAKMAIAISKDSD